MISQEQLDNWFEYHAPVNHSTLEPGNLQARYESIRAAGKQMAETVVALTPSSADQLAAVRKIREAVFTANAALACEGK